VWGWLFNASSFIWQFLSLPRIESPVAFRTASRSTNWVIGDKSLEHKGHVKENINKSKRKKKNGHIYFWTGDENRLELHGDWNMLPYFESSLKQFELFSITLHSFPLRTKLTSNNNKHKYDAYYDVHQQRHCVREWDHGWYAVSLLPKEQTINKRLPFSDYWIHSPKAAVFRNFRDLGALKDMVKNHKIAFLIALQNSWPTILLYSIAIDQYPRSQPDLCCLN
jgi:hypothetical protein